MFERFTDRARQVMMYADREAKRFRHSRVETLHVLLAICREGNGIACQVLHNLDIDLRKIRLECEKRMHSGDYSIADRRLPLATRTELVVKLANAAAKELGHDYVGTEHLLLGLCDITGCLAESVLNSLRVTAGVVRREIHKLLCTPSKETDMKCLCLVSCRRADGVPELYPCVVTTTADRYEEGLHHDKAQQMAALDGYTNIGLVYDHKDGPAALFAHYFKEGQPVMAEPAEPDPEPPKGGLDADVRELRTQVQQLQKEVAELRKPSDVFMPVSDEYLEQLRQALAKVPMRICEPQTVAVEDDIKQVADAMEAKADGLNPAAVSEN